MEPVTIPRDQHPVSRSMIDPDVVRILYRLKHEGYEGLRRWRRHPRYFTR